MTQVKGEFAKGISVFLAVLMVFTMLPGGLHAKASGIYKLNIDYGGINFSPDGCYYYASSGATGASKISSSEFSSSIFEIEGSDQTSNTIIVSGAAINIQLDGVNISSGTAAPIRIESGSTVNLALLGDNYLTNMATGGAGSYAGLSVERGGSVTIGDAYSGDSLTATGGLSSAGIGQSYTSSKINLGVGKITINSGKICAYGKGEEDGQYGGAGIGACSNSGSENGGATIIINGGTVEATGGAAGAGIGDGGHCTCNSSIFINGGSVTANGGVNGSGIGSGAYATYGTVSISGGSVKAKGGAQARDIGDGYKSCLSQIYISGGSVDADTFSPNPCVSSSDSRKVYKTTVTLPGGTNTRVDALDIRQGGSSGTSYSYGGVNPANRSQNMNMTVDSNDSNSRKLYLWLPQDSDTYLSFTLYGKSGNESYTDFHGAVDASNNSTLKLDQLPLTISGLQDEYTCPAVISAYASGGTTENTIACLYSGRDGTTYSSNVTAPTAVGKYTFTATMPGNETYYDVIATKNFEIDPNTSDMKIATIPDQPYTGSKITPDLTVTANGAPLTKGVDYTASFSGNTSVGTANVVVTGINSYAGYTASATFNIVASLQSITIGDGNLEAGKSEPLTATGHYSDSSTKDLTNSVTWSLGSGSDIASIDSSTGILTSNRTGTGNVTVRATATDGSGIYGTATFTIEAAPTVSVSGDTADWCASLPFTVTATAGSSGIKSVTVTDSKNNKNDITSTLANGVYSYMATENDTYTFTVTSNSGFTASKIITVSNVDNAPPVFVDNGNISGNLISPAQSAALSVTVVPGPSGIGSVSVSRSTDGGQSWTKLTGASISDHTNADGSHTYTYTATQNDAYKFTVASNVDVLAESNSVDVTQIDTAKPVVSIDSNGYTGGTWINKGITLNISNSTANLGTTKYEFSTDGGNTWTAFSGSITDSTEGVKTYSLRATSESKVQSDVKTFTVKIDQTVPGTHQITIANNNFTKFLDTITFGLFFKDTQTATVTAADSGSSVASVQYQLVHNQNEYDPNGTWTAYPSGGVSLNPNNKYIVYAKITDNAGNFIIVNSNGVIVDQASPELTISTPAGWLTSDTLSISVAAGDALAGLQSVSYTTNEAMPQSGSVTLTNGFGRIALADEGDYILTVTAMDNAGNTVNRTAHIQWDKTKPTITTSINTTSPTQLAMLTVAATSGASGIKRVTVSKDNGPAEDITDIYQYGYPVLDNGSYVLTVTNNAGISVSSFPVVVTQIDAAKPVVNIDSNGYADGTWTKNDVTLDVSNSTLNLGTTTYEYSTNGGKTWTAFSGNLTDSAEGVTAYSFRATSQSGVVSDVQSITVQIDKTAPTGMAIGFKQNPFKTVAHFATFGLFFGDTVDVNFSANDPNGSGVNHYEYQTAAEGGAVNPSGTWQTGPLSIQPDFKGTIYARAVDQAGNKSGYVTKSLVVDQTAPVITANSGNSTLTTMDAKASIPVKVEESGAGVGTVAYQINGGAVKSVDLTTDTYSDLTKDYFFNIGNLPDGVYDVTINAQDNSGNAAATATVHVVKNAAQTGFGFASAILSKTYGDASFTVAATGGQGGGAITYAVTSGADILSVDATTGKTTIQKAGTAVITATKAAGNGYCQATAELTVNVSKATPTIQTLPTASDIQVVGKLSSSKLSGGNASVPGVFIWTNPAAAVSASGSYNVTFTPMDTDNYKAVNGKVDVAVSPLLTGGGSSAQLDFTGVTLPAGVTSVSLGSNVQDNSSATYSVVENLIAQDQALGNLNSLAVYDLKLLDQNGNPIENFSGKIKVKIPIPKGMSGNLKVLWYNPVDDTLMDMNATQENGYLTFETTHFSYYAITQLTSTGSSYGTTGGTVPNPKTGSNSCPVIPLVLFGAGSVAGLIITRKHVKYRVKR